MVEDRTDATPAINDCLAVLAFVQTQECSGAVVGLVKLVRMEVAPALAAASIGLIEESSSDVAQKWRGSASSVTRQRRWFCRGQMQSRAQFAQPLGHD
eukprot:7298798-Pyramimonas_sp.AAC.1